MFTGRGSPQKDDEDDRDVSEMLLRYETKIKQSKDRSIQILTQKSRVAKEKGTKVVEKLSNRQEIQEKIELDNWASFIHQRSKRELKMNRFSKQKNFDMQHRREARQFQWQQKQDQILRHRDNKELEEQIEERMRA